MHSMVVCQILFIHHKLSCSREPHYISIIYSPFDSFLSFDITSHLFFHLPKYHRYQHHIKQSYRWLGLSKFWLFLMHTPHLDLLLSFCCISIHPSSAQHEYIVSSNIHRPSGSHHRPGLQLLQANTAPFLPTSG